MPQSVLGLLFLPNKSRQSCVQFTERLFLCASCPPKPYGTHAKSPQPQANKPQPHFTNHKTRDAMKAFHKRT